MPTPYDAILIVSFGGPDGPDDVLPFLENVLRGRNVPRERMLEVAEHYYHFGGRSPINDQNRALIAALEQELAEHGPHLPVYWGNRNWHPLLAETLRRMAADGVQRALAFFTSAYSSYSGCRQYRENIAAAQAEVGETAPQVDKLRTFFNHPGFIEPMIEHTRAALDQIPAERRANALLLFTAHSIPQAMADGCRYEAQLQEASRLVATGLSNSAREAPRQPPALPGVLGTPQSLENQPPAEPGATSQRETTDQLGDPPWRLVYQSRSGPPQQPWLEPDVGDFIRSLRVAGVEAKTSPQSADHWGLGRQGDLDPSHPAGVRDIVVVPIGFISDHMEVLFDLDTEAKQICDELGINMVRAATVGTHPRFIRMIRELIEERVGQTSDRQSLGSFGPTHDVCPVDCCLYTPVRPTSQPK